MLAARAGLRRCAAVRSLRWYASEGGAEHKSVEEFKESWKKVAPTLDLPRFPPGYLAPRPPGDGPVPAKMKLNLALPSKVQFAAEEVDMVILPATTGQLGILPGHVPTIVELKAGLLSVHKDDTVREYFVSSGFAFVHGNSMTDVAAIEALELDQIDPEEVRKGLAEYTQLMNTASTELEKAEAQIGLEVHSALSTALRL